MLKKRNLIIFCLLVIVIAITCYAFFISTQRSTALNGPEDGKLLASQYCQSCHQLPSPGLLDKITWHKFLPQMGLMLGVRSFNGVSYINHITPADQHLYPSKPFITDEQWQKIIDYYQDAAPRKLSIPKDPINTQDVHSFFTLAKSPSYLDKGNLLTCFVKIDHSVNPARIFVFERNSRQLYLFSDRLRLLDSVQIDGNIVDMSFNYGQILACSIGKTVNPLADSDRSGTIFPITVSKNHKIRILPPLFTRLARPVQIVAADLNGDHLIDYVICEFGKLTGELIWMENKGYGKFTAHVIRAVPGSEKIIVDDRRKNRLPDLWVLFAQGDEGIFHFINKGGGKFETSEVLKFPPIYGSTSFQMIDMNHDSYPDIVYCCGDNGDLTPIIKPYHGVYIFLNDGSDHFKQVYFHHIDGCFKVIAKDFTGNGKIDLAAIALFTDPAKPERSFLFLKNTDNLNFTEYHLPKIASERFITLDSGTLNNQNCLLLGGACFSNGNTGKKGFPFLLLKQVIPIYKPNINHAKKNFYHLASYSIYH
jgi:hypothetical protein